MTFTEQQHRMIAAVGEFGGDTLAQKAGFVLAAGNVAQWHNSLHEFNAEWTDVVQLASGIYVICQLGYFLYKVLWKGPRE
jgi:hypothetical protein